MNTINAENIEGTTMLGVDLSFSPPYKNGNCFSVKAENGICYRIVNFNYENLKEVLKHVSWPVKMHVLKGKVAVIHDERIPDEWYRKTYCTVCCPPDLLTETQRLQRDRQIKSGYLEIGDGWEKIDPSKKVKLSDTD